MDSVKVLKLNKQMWRIMGLMLSSKERINRANRLWIAVLFAIQLAVWFPIFAHLVYIWGDIADTTDAMYTVCTFSMALEMYAIFVMRKSDLNRLLASLDAIIQKRTDKASVECYKQTEEKITMFTKRCIAVVSTVATGCFLVPVGVALFTYVRGNYSPDVWFYPLQVVMPFSNKPGSLGFFVTFILEWVSGYVLMCIFSSVNSFYFGISWMIDTCISDSFRFFRQMDAIISNAAHHQEPQLEVKKLLIEFIRLHNDIMSFLDDFAEFMSDTIFFTFIIGVLWLCSALFQIQATATEFDFRLAQCIMTTITVTLFLFVFSFFGNMITVKSAEVADQAYDSLWYRYPRYLQPHYILIIRRSNEPLIISGYKMMRCSLPGFTNLLNTAGSYYLLLRSLN